MAAVVSGEYKDPTGVPESGTVTFTLVPAAVDNLDKQRTPGSVTATLDENGMFSVTLVTDPELQYVEGVTAYAVAERVGQLDRRWYLYLSSDDPVDLPSRYPGTELGDTPVAVLPVQGEPGLGIPEGGLSGQVLTKSGDADYETTWTNPGTDLGSAVFWSETTSGPPGDGRIAADRTYLETVSEFRVADRDGEGNTVPPLDAGISIGDSLTISTKITGTVAVYTVRAAVTHPTGYYSIPVDYVSGQGGNPAHQESVSVKLVARTNVSEDLNNQAVLGSDGLIHVPVDMLVVQSLEDVPPSTPANTVVVVPK